MKKVAASMVSLKFSQFEHLPTMIVAASVRVPKTEIKLINFDRDDHQ